MIDEVFRKNKTDKKITDADERFLKISLMPDGSKVVDAKSSRIAYVADPKEDKDVINKSWAEAYFKKEKDAVTKLEEEALAKSAEIDSKLVKFKADKESIERTQGELKALNEDTKTKLEDASTKLNETIKHIDEAKSKLAKFNEDYANTLNINTNVDSKANEVKASLESVKAIFNSVSNMGADIVNVYNRAKQDIATTKADIDTKANLALNTATSSLNEIKTILNDFKGKQTELNALKDSLEALKDSLEKLKATGVINDTASNLTQTYSSKKIEGLVENAKTTLANDIKNKTDSLTSSLTSQSQSITDLDSKVTTTQDNLSTFSTDTLRALGAKADKEAFERSASAMWGSINQKADKTDILSKTTIEEAYLKKTDADLKYSEKLPYIANFLPVQIANAGTYDEFRIVSPHRDKKTRNLYVKGISFDLPSSITNPLESDKLSFMMLQTSPFDSNEQIIKQCSVLKLHSYITSYIRKKMFDYNVVADYGIGVDFTKGTNFEYTLKSRVTFSVSSQFSQDLVGQNGIIVVKNAKLIGGWDGVYVWREVPTDLNDIEVFAYFISPDMKIYMGRA